MNGGMFSRVASLAALLLFGAAVAAAEPAPHSALAEKIQPVQSLDGHLAFRTENCLVMVFQAGGGSVLLVVPESPEMSIRVSRVCTRLTELLFPEKKSQPESISAGDARLVLPRAVKEKLLKQGCLEGSGVQALVHLVVNSSFCSLTMNERGRAELRREDEDEPALRFFPAARKLPYMEVSELPDGRRGAEEIAEALGYGEDASRATRERLSRNLKCRVLYYNSDDEALMAEIRGRVYVGQRDAVRELLDKKGSIRSRLRFPEQAAVLPKRAEPPPPPMPGADEALSAYLRYLKEL